MKEEASQTASEEGLQRVREILFGEILVELERRLGKLENYIQTRSNDVQHDARQRMNVLEGHLKKEVEAVAARATREASESAGELRAVRHEQHDAIVALEQRIVHCEEHVEAQLARIERDGREQLLANAKSFFEELAQLRSEFRQAAARAEDEEESRREEGAEHASSGPH